MKHELRLQVAVKVPELRGLASVYAKARQWKARTSLTTFTFRASNLNTAKASRPSVRTAAGDPIITTFLISDC